MIDFVIGIIAALVVIFVVVDFIKKAKSGKSSCGCSCKNCPSNKSCDL